MILLVFQCISWCFGVSVGVFLCFCLNFDVHVSLYLCFKVWECVCGCFPMFVCDFVHDPVAL